MPSLDVLYNPHHKNLYLTHDAEWPFVVGSNDNVIH